VQLFVRNLDGKTIVIDVNSLNDKGKTAIPTDQQRLLVGRKELVHDGLSLSFYNIERESSIEFFLLRIRGGAKCIKYGCNTIEKVDVMVIVGFMPHLKLSYKVYINVRLTDVIGIVGLTLDQMKRLPVEGSASSLNAKLLNTMDAITIVGFMLVWRRRDAVDTSARTTLLFLETTACFETALSSMGFQVFPYDNGGGRCPRLSDVVRKNQTDQYSYPQSHSPLSRHGSISRKRS
jgi:hypothetical protein